MDVIIKLNPSELIPDLMEAKQEILASKCLDDGFPIFE